MSDYYLGQIMLAGFGFAPRFFSSCNGQLIPLQQNQALYSLLGVQYGGDGIRTFALPDLRSRVPVGSGPSADATWQPPAYSVGQMAGVEAVSLISTQMPIHSHAFNAAAAAGTVKSPTNALYGGFGTEPAYAAPSPLVPLAPATIGPGGGNQPHPNVQPLSVLGFNIALSGIFPSRA